MHQARELERFFHLTRGLKTVLLHMWHHKKKQKKKERLHYCSMVPLYLQKLAFMPDIDEL